MCPSDAQILWKVCGVQVIKKGSPLSLGGEKICLSETLLPGTSLSYEGLTGPVHPPSPPSLHHLSLLFLGGSTHLYLKQTGHGYLLDIKTTKTTCISP